MRSGRCLSRRLLLRYSERRGHFPACARCTIGRSAARHFARVGIYHLRYQRATAHQQLARADMIGFFISAERAFPPRMSASFSFSAAFGLSMSQQRVASPAACHRAALLMGARDCDVSAQRAGR